MYIDCLTYLGRVEIKAGTERGERREKQTPPSELYYLTLLFFYVFSPSRTHTRAHSKCFLASGAAQEVGPNLVCWDELIN